MVQERPVPTQQLQPLRRQVIERFSLEELRALAFDLGVDHERFPDGGKESLARELVQHANRDGQLPALLTQLRALRPSVTWAIDDLLEAAEPPYRGLDFYREQDAALFFGRARLTAELVERLRTGSFLAIVGASGSGKSSVVRAGVTAALRGEAELPAGCQAPDGSDDWAYLTITPTDSPLERLALALTSDLVAAGETRAIIRDLGEDPSSLRLYVRKYLERQSRPRLFLLVDQFEELFTVCKEETQRRAYIEALLAAVDSGSPLTLVITLRADFYHHCAQYDGLRHALEQRQTYIGAPSADELREAIVEPAGRRGYGLEPGLAELMLRDVGDEPGALPLLSHALLETWARREGRTLTLAGYNDAGGVRGAIARTAERVYGDLDETGRVIAQRIFVELAELGEGTEDTRRRLRLDELAGHTWYANGGAAVLEGLVRTRLVTADDQTVQIAHEALIREWPRLREWLDADRAGERLRRRLDTAAKEWEVNAYEPSYLYSGARLLEGEEWAVQHPDLISKRVEAFLINGRNREAAERYVKQRRERLLRIVTLLLAILLILASLAAWLARTRNVQYAEQLAMARSRAAAFAATELRGDDPTLALLLAVEAGRNHETLEAQNALHATLSQPGIQYASLPHGGRINHIAWSKQADVLLTSSDDGAVRIWDAVTLSESLRVKHDDSVNTATWSHDETRILSASDDGTARIWDASSGQLELSLTHGNPVIDAAWNSSEELIATLSGNDVIIWDGASGQRLHILNRDNHISEILWSNTGRFLLISTQASGGGGGVTDLWFADTQEIRRLQEKNIVTAQWSQDDSRLLTGDVEGNVQMWDVPTRRELKSFQHEAQIMTLDWSNSEQSILASSLDDKVQVWDVQTGEVVLALEAGDFAQWNEDESEILTEGYSSGYYRIAVWDAVSGEELVSLRNQDYGGDLRWNDSGRLIAATDYWSWEVRLFCAEQQPEEDLFSHDSQVFEAEYNSSGQQILSVSADQIARVWDVESGTIALELIHAYSDEVDSLEFESTLQDAYWSPSEEQILTTGRGITKVWDGKSGEILFEFAGESYAKYSHDGAYFATTNVADKVWIRDSITGTNTNHLTHRGYLVTDMLWSPNDQRIAILSHTPQFFDRTFGLWIWNLQTSTTTLLRAEDTPFDVIWSKDGKRLLARIGYFDTTINRVEIWNSESGDTISAIYEGPPISTAKWNRNERRVLLVPEDNGEVAVIDLFSNERVLTFTVPSVVLYAEWSPDERHVLTSSSDGTIRMWDGDTGELVSEVKSNVYNPVWRGDGKRFLAIREQSQINTFYVVEQELRTAACDRLGRNLTWLEWQQYFPAEPYRQTCPNLPVHFTVPEESRP